MQQNFKTVQSVRAEAVSRENAALSRRIENVKSEYSRSTRKAEAAKGASRIKPTRPGKLWAVAGSTGAGATR